MYCGEHTVVKSDYEHAIAVSLRCRSWTCPDCQPMRHRQLIAQGMGGRPNTFLTLTSRRREEITPEEAARRLAWAWRTLVKRIKRRYQLDALDYLAVVERHKSGWPHLHILARMPFVPQAWISQQMAELADGPIVHIRRIDQHGRHIAYVAKYCGKCTQKVGTCKRYWQTRGYDQRPPEQKEHPDRHRGGWEHWDKPLSYHVKAWTELGYRVHVESKWKAYAEKVPPWDTG